MSPDHKNKKLAIDQEDGLAHSTIAGQQEKLLEEQRPMLPTAASKALKPENRNLTVLVFLVSGLIALSIFAWNPADINEDTLLDGTLPAGGNHLGQKPLAYSELAPFKLDPLPLGSVKPGGWVRDQMELMADGLAGHLHDFYHIVNRSPWLGGHTEYSGLHEGLPYWFNGLVPLAYGLDDERLQSQVLQVLDEVLSRQTNDGWLGPEHGRDRDIWGRFPFCLGLIQLAEAQPNLTEKIVAALYKYVRIQHQMLQRENAYHSFWGEVRYPDMLATLQWLFDHHPQGNEGLLMDSMLLLREQGFDWPGYWTNASFIFVDLDTVKPAIEGDTWRFRHSHSVNVGQGLSAGAALYRFTKNESLLDANRQGVDWTLKFHGDVAGSVIGDERESGSGPNRGSELCTASETMYSLSYLYHVIGDKEFADRCELASFNAWPVAITADHWARQYLTVANAPESKTLHGRLNWWNVGSEGLVYGVDTNYPCCTVNMPQGLPKFLSASFVRVGLDGIGHALLGPASVDTTTLSGRSVNITCETAYPFGLTLKYTVQSSGDFKFYLRVPSWVSPSSVITLGDQADSQSLSPDEQTGMTSISLGPGEHSFTYNLETDLRVVPRGNSSVAIYHGALLYALDVGESRYFSANKPSPNITYSKLDGPIKFPKRSKRVEITHTSPWNIGIDPDTLHFHTTKADEPLANPIFDYEAPPGRIEGKGCLIDWPLKHGVPIALAALPDGQSKRKCSGEEVDIILRPYASLKAHMAELPVVDLKTATKRKKDV